MKKFKLYVLGNYSPNCFSFGKCKCTSYELIGFKKQIYLDFGAGVFFKFLRRIKKNQTKLNDIIIIVSHNHIDHNFSLFFLSFYLYFRNKIKKENNKVKVILPKRSIIFSIVNYFDKVFDVQILNEDYTFEEDGCKFSFCHTIHKGESYATKIEYGAKKFVYTADIAEMSDELSSFIANADTVLVDAGYPVKLSRIFCKYHGRTGEILREVHNRKVKTILATHLRFFALSRDYYRRFPKGSDTKLVKMNKYYDLF